MKKPGNAVESFKSDKGERTAGSIRSVEPLPCARLRPWLAFYASASNPGVITADLAGNTKPALPERTWTKRGATVASPLDSLDQRPVLSGRNRTASPPARFRASTGPAAGPAIPALQC
jgi:hypothetical protein